MFAKLIYCWSKIPVLAFNYPKMSQSFFGLILADVPPGVGVGEVGVSWVRHHPDVQRALEIFLKDPLNHFQQLLFCKGCSKFNHCSCPWWGSPMGGGWLGLDFIQMPRGIWKLNCLHFAGSIYAPYHTNSCVQEWTGMCNALL